MKKFKELTSEIEELLMKRLDLEKLEKDQESNQSV